MYVFIMGGNMSQNFLAVLSTFLILYLTMHIFAYAQGQYGYGENLQVQQLKEKIEKDDLEIKADRSKLKQDLRQLQKDREAMYKLKRRLMNERYRQHQYIQSNSTASK